MADSSSTNANVKPKVYIVIYTLYHHIYKLSLAIQEALEQNGVEAKIFQVQETLTESILEKMHAPAKPDVPIITAQELTEPDGIFFGIPTRFGIFPAQIKALLDATGKIWAQGSLAGKFVATFFSTASQHGGQETTALNAVTYFAHHGMIYVPFGFANAAMFDNNEVIGGSAYGAGTVTNGDGSRQPSETELAIAKNQATNFAAILNTYLKGKLAASTRTTKAAAIEVPPTTSSSEAKNAESKTPVITTTNPEGQTQHEPTSSGSTAAAVATGAVAGGAVAGAVGSTEAATKATQPSAEPGAKEVAPATSAPSSDQGQQQATATEQQQGQEAARPSEEKPKKKKKLLWFCCGNNSQLD